MTTAPLPLSTWLSVTHCRYLITPIALIADTLALFPNGKHLVIGGGTFKSVTNIHEVPIILLVSKDHTFTKSLSRETYDSWIDFRIIPLGDLNLLHKIGTL
jgi:hypothetical protein